MPGDDQTRGPSGGWRVPGYTARQGIAVDRAGALVAATEDETGRRVVLRVLTPALAGDPVYLRRLRAALPELTAARDDHLVPVLALVEPPATLVYGSLAGPMLAAVIDRAGALPPAAAFLVLDDVLLALTALHAAGVTHGDVRPTSIVVGDDGAVRLLDAMVPAPPLKPGMPPGTPQYMAPELWGGARASVASDLYAASAVFVESLSGGPPFPVLDLDGLRHAHEAGTLADPGLAAPAKALANQGLAKDPSSRPDDAVRFREDLDTAAAAFLDEGWRQSGRAWLVGANRNAARVVQPLPPPLQPQQRALSPEPLLVASPARPLWRDPRLLAGAALALVVVVVLVVLALAAGRATPNDASPSPTTSGAQASATPLFSTSPTVTAESPSATPAPSPSTSSSATSAPTSSGGVSFGPGTPTPHCPMLVTPCP